MVVSLVFGILLFNVAFADDLTNGFAQPKVKAQNFTFRSSAGPSLSPTVTGYRYHNYEINRPQFNGVAQNQNEGQEKCPSYNGLLTIIDKLLTIINEYPSKADTVAEYKELLKAYSKYPNIAENRALPLKKADFHPKDEDDKLDSAKILFDNNVLRMSNYNSKLEGGVKTKIMFKYELPNINLPNCKDAFLNLMQTAYETYEHLAKYPMCQKTPNILSNINGNDSFNSYINIPNTANNQPLLLTSYEKAPLQNANDLNQPNIFSILEGYINSQNTPANQTPYNPFNDNKKDLLIKIVQRIPDINIRTMYINIIKNMRPDDMHKIPDNFIKNVLMKYYTFENGINPEVLQGNHPMNPKNDDIIKFIIENMLPNNDPSNNQIHELPQFPDIYPGVPNSLGNTPPIYGILNPGVEGFDLNTLFNKVPILKLLLLTYGNKPISHELISLLLKIPYLKEHILKLYGILTNPNIDLSNIELLNLLVFNKINNSGGKIPTLLELLRWRNQYKSEPNNAGIMELTYIVRKVQPDYFVKYQLPYSEYVNNVQNILRNKPHLRLHPLKLYQEIMSLSNVSDMSPDLRAYTREDIIKLTSMNGELVGAKLLNADDNLKQKLVEVQNLNNNIEADEILKLNNYNEMKYYNVQELYNNMDVGKTISETVQVPTSYYPINYLHQQKINQDLSNPMIMGNVGLQAMNPIIASGMTTNSQVPFII